MEAEALDPCPWLCGGPSYPNTPFAWPVFAVVDTVRILICAAAAALVVTSVWSIRKAVTHGQRCRFLYVVGTASIMIGTEVEHLGDWPHWRFLVSLVTVAIGAYGVWQHLFHEIPAAEAPPERSSPR